MNAVVFRHTRAVALAIVTIAVAPGAHKAWAQDKYPSRPLTIVVATAPGSSTDARARLTANKMRTRFGQPLIIENKAGAGGIIGLGYVAKSKPDGYTILHTATSNLSTAPGTVKALPFDPVQDFSGIIISSEGYIGLLVRPDFKGMSFPQFLERARKSPELLSIAGSNVGNEVLLKQLADATKLPLTYVRYNDYGRMMTDLWGGRLGGAFGLLSLTLAPHKSGQGYLVAMSGPERLSSLPDMPTMDETLSGVVNTSTSGYFAPAGTPRPIVNQLHAQFFEAGKDPEVLAANSDGGRAMFMKPEETDAFMKKEVERWSAQLKAAGFTPQ
jgi:tripartite-type tricarboxylate transporter receptor subunit TctC